MCLLAVTKKRTAIPRDYLQNAYDHNSDGWGTMYAEGGRVIVRKEFSGYAAFLAHWETLPPKAKVAVHFRFGTSGGVSDNTCHPFQVLSIEHDGKDLWLMHNGVLSHGRFPGGKSESDTMQYVAGIARQLKLAPHLLYSQDWLEDQEDILGSNKMVLLEGDGRFHFLNRAEGTQIGKTWYSNEYSLRPVFSGHGKGKAANSATQTSYTKSGYYSGGKYYADATSSAVVTRPSNIIALADWYFDQKANEWWKPWATFSFVCMERNADGKMERKYVPKSGVDYITQDKIDAHNSYGVDVWIKVSIKDVAKFEDGGKTHTSVIQGETVVDCRSPDDLPGRQDVALLALEDMSSEPLDRIAFDEQDAVDPWHENNLKLMDFQEMSDQIFQDSDNAAYAMARLLGLDWGWVSSSDETALGVA